MLPTSSLSITSSAICGGVSCLETEAVIELANVICNTIQIVALAWIGQAVSRTEHDRRRHLND
jgi:hypothetical protein